MNLYESIRENLNEKNYLKENKRVLTESESESGLTKVWSSEMDIDDYDQDELKELYDEYVTETGKENAKDFDEWKYDYLVSDADYQWETAKDDLDFNIYPMVDKQINNDILIISGNYNSHYPDFRPSGKGGKFLNKAEDILNWLSNEDRIDFYKDTDNNMVVKAYDHDGSIAGGLYTLPDDKDLLYKIAMDTDYYDSDDKDDVLNEFIYDINNGNIDMSVFRGFEDKFIPIKFNL